MLNIEIHTEVTVNVRLAAGELIIRRNGTAWSVAQFSVRVQWNVRTRQWVTTVHRPVQSGSADTLAFRAYGEKVAGGWSGKAVWPRFFLSASDISDPIMREIVKAYSNEVRAIPEFMPALAEML